MSWHPTRSGKAAETSSARSKSVPVCKVHYFCWVAWKSVHWFCLWRAAQLCQMPLQCGWQNKSHPHQAPAELSAARLFASMHHMPFCEMQCGFPNSLPGWNSHALSRSHFVSQSVCNVRRDLWFKPVGRRWWHYNDTSFVKANSLNGGWQRSKIIF